MQRNKYLEDLGLNINEYGVNPLSEKKDSRKRRWRKQKRDYGFDDRETWGLDYCFAEWLYSHLMMYKEMAGKIVNLNYYKFNWQGKEITQLEAIDILINASRDYILVENSYVKNIMSLEEINKIHNTFKESMTLWGMIIQYMWW